MDLILALIGYLGGGIFLFWLSEKDYPFPAHYVFLAIGIIFCIIAILCLLASFNQTIVKIVRRLRDIFDFSLLLVTSTGAINLLPQFKSPLLILGPISIGLIFILVMMLKNIISSIRSFRQLGYFLHRTIPGWIIVTLAKSWLDGIYPELFPFSPAIFLVIAVWCFGAGYMFKDMD